MRIAITSILAFAYFFLPKYGYDSQSGIAQHLLYPISHANIFHLAANIVCLWMIKCPVNILITYPICVIASFFPSFFLYGNSLTMGFSGVLFAMVGITWGRIDAFKRMFLKNKWYLIIPFFIPNINAFIHVYCLLFGFAYGLYINNISQSVCNRR